MKIFDMHIHAFNTTPDPDRLIREMSSAGIWGGCIFSNCPKLEGNREENIYNGGTTFEERLEEVFGWTRGYEDRLFPVLWIHPDEENIIEKIHIAVDRGIVAFKMICNEYFVYEEKSLKVLREIAKLDKPVFFHSGILWGGEVSSQYNRPVNWEAIMEIKGLRFSMGHCAWPWVDECIAMYGKFLNALVYRNTAEMFFDITPGTPRIYREELLTKLYTIGYDVGHNVMFGTDTGTESYNSKWAKSWLDTDREILQKLGVSKENLNLMYHDNLLRFLGKTEVKVSHKSPVPDDANFWTPTNDETKTVIEKWYKKLGFSKKYDEEFYDALENIKISDSITIDNYNHKEKDGKRNFLSFLFMCEELEKKYREKGISEEILLDTLHDIVYWTDTWSSIKHELYLGELAWLSRHMRMKLFKLGRLQFCIAGAECDVLDKGIKKDDKIMEIHIPAGEPLNIEECKKSIENSKEFFEKYFGDYKFEYYTCHSWLLDKTLGEILPENSNILKFQELFDIVVEQKSDATIRYVFNWNTYRDDVKNLQATSSLAEKVKARVKMGGDFYENLGVIKK